MKRRFWIVAAAILTFMLFLLAAAHEIRSCAHCTHSAHEGNA